MLDAGLLLFVILWIKAGILSNGTPWSARALINSICCCTPESNAEPPAGGAAGFAILYALFVLCNMEE